MWRPRLGAAIAAVAVLTGCATVPTTGPVREHEAGNQQVASGVKVAPVPPAVDSPAMLIVEGFLHAMGTDQAGFPVARQYLTAEANQAWRPESGTLIYADGYQPRESDTGTEDEPGITLEAVLTGTLDSQGEYHEASGGHRQEFGLVRDADGQWRISRPPEGLLISRYHFVTNYTALNLHYMDVTGTVLVPDPRYLAQNMITPKAVAEAQLAGPGEWLAPAVRRAPWSGSIIEQVELLPQGVVVLHLGESAADLSDDQRRTLMAEFTTTLTALPQVPAVQFSVGPTLLSLPGSTSVTLNSSDFAAVAPAITQRNAQLLAVREGVVRMISTAQQWNEGAAIAHALTAPGAIAARGDLAELAAVDSEGTRLTVTAIDSDAGTVLLEGKQLLRPDYSRQGELWAIGNEADAAGFAVFSADDHSLVPVVANDIPTDPVRAFRISPDGARIALVLDGPVVDGVSVEQLGVARIVRSQDGIALESFRSVTVSPPAEAARRIFDVGWQMPTELLVLISHRVTSSVIEVDQDSARAEDIGPAEVSGLRELAVTPGGQAVVRGAGPLYRFEGAFNWELTGISADAIAYA